MITEKQLIKDCQRGVKSSQYELVKRYSGMLMAICRRYAKDDPSAKDVLQESLIRIFSNINKYKNTGSYEAWMKTITVRCALTWLDKSHFKKEVNQLDFHLNESVQPDVYDYLGVEEIQKMVEELPLGFRTVFQLNVIEGFSHKEIGELLQITESASRSQLTRAKRVLRKKIISRKNKNINRHEVG